MKCEIPGREKDIEGSLDSWLPPFCWEGAALTFYRTFFGDEMCHEGLDFHMLILFVQGSVDQRCQRDPRKGAMS